jgi:hypothetical protein
MNHLENSKSVTKIGTADTTTATTHQHSIDTLGFSYASVDVVFEPVASAGTNSAVAIALKLQEGDTTAAYSDISGFVGGTDFTVPTPSDTNSTNVVRFDIDLRGQKRFLNVFATPQAASVVASNARLGKGEDGVDSASEKGAGAAVSG